MEINKYNLPADILLLAVTADSFPEGVRDAYDKLGSKVPDIGKRRLLGVSEQKNGKLVYKACTNQMAADEAGKFNTETYTVPAGNYLFLTLSDWQTNMELFNEYFEKLLAHPDAMKDSIGVEYYMNSNKDVMLMVRTV